MKNMKKLIIYISFSLMAVVLFSGCKKSDFSENYYNPEKAVTADVPSLYAGLFKNETILPRYWNLYTFQVPVLGTYTQIAGYTNGSGVYEQPNNYTGDRWNDFYKNVMARYREIEKHYNALTSADDKEGYKLFLETAQVFVYDQATQIVDMWGDIPFSTAGGLNAEGKIILPGYDNGESLYNTALTELKRISDYLATVTPNNFYLSQLKSTDYVNSGDLLKWRKYTNSVLLRLAMRISYKDEAKAKSIVQGLLANPTQYPLAEDVLDKITIQPNSPTSSLAPADQKEIWNGFDVIPYPGAKMVNEIMVPTNDPRLPVYFTTNKNGVYNGVANTLTEAQVAEGATNFIFSRWDSTTFTYNHLLPGILVTPAEVNLLKAEAFERWGGGSAKDAYEKGIRLSIAFWYGINNISDRVEDKVEPPTEAAIMAYLAKPLVAYGTDNLNKIATQKWINFTIMQAQIAWSEIRRTKLPVLSFPNDPTSVAAPNPPTRLLYPSAERTLNTANYNAVKDKDNTTTKLFWDVR
ncbi:SusD/RagB family nutrient-binding outer membrane lipoprotein [Chitinophagaceae bacterium LB-8]|uniref:SusD/RagB family nutrient-binding outer membrane lipoprotein n=1 Tax=Paraflavisolibacter caeni TaxID=2982496 RepID=A0A9X2XUI6_9BACT|nr:SusD/RagB family nutrient-binding outer membrane lipoprotein [Paraflavisolibacter caeni]MCU7548742.1 SusD/RagB family nutrient-binding outer membrane lipoprotein [Paraflavisolibacter caeni]